MANATANYGLVPYKNLYGSSFPVMDCHVAVGYGTALFVGDPVILAGSGAPLTAQPTIQIAIGSEGTPSTNLFGVITNVSPVGPDSLNVVGSAASTAASIQVVPCLPGMIFRVNCNDDAGLALNDIGNGFDLVLGTGDSLTGRSGWALDDNTGATTGTQVRLLGFDNRSDNTWSTTLATATNDVDALIVIAQSFWHNDMGAGI